MTNKTPFSTLTSIQRLTMKMESNYWMYLEKVNGKNLVVCIEKTEKGYEVTNLDDNSFYGIGKNFMQAIAIIYKVNTGKISGNNTVKSVKTKEITLKAVFEEALQEAKTEKDSGKSWAIKDVYQGLLVVTGLDHHTAKAKQDFSKGYVLTSYATSKALEYKMILDSLEESA